MICTHCNDRRWVFSTRDDGQGAIERCDECQPDSFTDEDAARLARDAGVDCDVKYPCILKNNYSVTCAECGQWLPEDDDPWTWAVFGGHHPMHLSCWEAHNS